MSEIEKRLEALETRLVEVERKLSKESHDGPFGANTYKGPLFPRVYPTLEGKRLVEFNPHQAVEIEVRNTGIHEVPQAPGIRARLDLGEWKYELHVYPGRQRLGDWKEEGEVITREQMKVWPEQYRPNPHPGEA